MINITCSVEQLKNAVQLVDRMTGKTLTLPLLHAIQISAKGNKAILTATNLSVGIEYTISAQVVSEGTVLVRGDILSNICNNLTGDTVTISLTNENLTITTAQNNTIIKSLPPEEFPTLPIVDGQAVEISTEVLRDGIRSVYFAAATTDIKPEIASIFMYTEQESIVFVATDSFRLAEKKISVKKIPDITKILLPYKNISDILRVLDGISGPVTIVYTANQISFLGDGIYFTSRLIDGGFPPYQMILPKETETKVVILKQELLSTLRLSTVFADKFFQVVFTITEDKKVQINSKNNDIGSSLSSIDAAVEGNPIEVSFNLKYFLDVFQSLQGDSVVLSFTKENKPIVVRSTQDQSFLYLLMPTNR